jgi:hypothetical protein
MVFRSCEDFTLDAASIDPLEELVEALDLIIVGHTPDTFLVVGVLVNLGLVSAVLVRFVVFVFILVFVVLKGVLTLADFGIQVHSTVA